jgi:NitT/TauT family transport system ATP-binding protein
MIPTIQFSGVSKRFFKGGRPVEVLEDVNLEVPPGQFLALVGPSGCGKSTLLNMAAGLLKPSMGQVSYRGEPVTAVNTQVGYVTQRDNLLPWRNVRDNVGISLEIRGGPTRAARRVMIDEVLGKLGLTGFEEHYPAELSGGMRKRVGLARTMIYGPETLLMDEPFGALDAQLKLILQAELLKVWERSEKTILFVTHDLGEAITLADRVVVFTARPGRIKAIHKIDLPRPRDTFRVRFGERFQDLHERIWDTMSDEVLLGSDV